MNSTATDVPQDGPPLGLGLSELLGAWVPVTKELPKRETDVLALVSQKGQGLRRMAVAGIFPSDGTALNPTMWGWFSYETPDKELTVTHWMPLPAPPQSA
jgi:hypothetical protein